MLAVRVEPAQLDQVERRGVPLDRRVVRRRRRIGQAVFERREGLLGAVHARCTGLGGARGGSRPVSTGQVVQRCSTMSCPESSRRCARSHEPIVPEAFCDCSDSRRAEILVTLIRILDCPTHSPSHHSSVWYPPPSAPLPPCPPPPLPPAGPALDLESPPSGDWAPETATGGVIESIEPSSSSSEKRVCWYEPGAVQTTKRRVGN